MDFTIVTNHVPRPVLTWWDLTPAERAEFDYVDWDDIKQGNTFPFFFRYRGEVYDLGEFTIWDNPNSPMKGWDGMQSDSYFSGILVKYPFAHDGDFDCVVVGRYYC